MIKKNNHKKIIFKTNNYGFTLVELLVAMALSGLVVLIALAALTGASNSLRVVDSTAELRDNGRFATGLLQRMVVQTGFQDLPFATNRAASEFLVDGLSPNPEPAIYGVNNAQYSMALALGTNLVSPNNGINGSDMLVLRYQPGETFPGSGVPDRTMISCDGTTPTSVPTTTTDQMISVIYVATNATTGISSLMCNRRDLTTGLWLPVPQPLIENVESFQVLYGVDNVVPGAAPVGLTDSVPDRYLRADQLAAGTAKDTYDNWRRVRSVRIGLVLVGARGTSVEAQGPNEFPLGTMGQMNNAADVGSTRVPPADGRLRQTVTFTVHLRNPQDT